MTTSVEDLMAQKILKVSDEHGKALKKMGGCLTRFEESKLKKSAHVEIHYYAEEVEEWDEKDKIEYEWNKQFEKLTTETIAIREKTEKMQLVFRKAQGMDDYLYNMGGVSSKAPIALPPKFKISNAKNFYGTHLSIIEMKGLDEK